MERVIIPKFLFAIILFVIVLICGALFFGALCSCAAGGQYQISAELMPEWTAHVNGWDDETYYYGVGHSTRNPSESGENCLARAKTMARSRIGELRAAQTEVVDTRSLLEAETVSKYFGENSCYVLMRFLKPLGGSPLVPELNEEEE